MATPRASGSSTCEMGEAIRRRARTLATRLAHQRAIPRRRRQRTGTRRGRRSCMGRGGGRAPVVFADGGECRADFLAHLAPRRRQGEDAPALACARVPAAAAAIGTVGAAVASSLPEYWGAEWFPKTGESISTVEFHNCHTWCSPQLGNFALNAGALFARIFVVYRLHVRCSAAISHDLVSVQAT